METAKFWKVQVDTGKNDSKREINQGKQAIKDAKEPYFGSWRDVTVDNSLMSAAMTEELFKQGTKLNRHNVLQQTRDPTGISSALQKGTVLKHFQVKE